MNSRLRICTFAVLAGLVACQPAADPAPDAALPQRLEIPAATGSMAPNLEPASDGTLVLSWIEPRGDASALRYARIDDAGISESATVITGAGWFVNWADFPSVVPVTESLWGAHWLVRRPAGGYAYDVHAAISTDAGRSWSESFLPHTDDTDTEHGFVSMFADGDGLAMVWLDGRKFVNEVSDDVAASGMTLRSATFDAAGVAMRESLVDELICDCCQTDVAATPDGAVAVYRDRTVDEIRDVYAARFVDGRWLPGVPVHRDGWEIPGCPVNGPVIEVHDERIAVAWFTAADDKPKVLVAFSEDGAASFSPPVVVAEGRLHGHVGATFLDDGDLVVSFQRAGKGGGAELMLGRISTEAELTAVVAVPQADRMFGFSVPQLERLGDDLVLVWTNSTDGEYSIDGLRFSPAFVR